MASIDKHLPKSTIRVEKENEIYFKNCKVIASQDKFVSDAIGDAYFTKWTPSTPVFISAQTGAGKNTFVEKVLIENLVPQRKILILSNRIALGRQEKGRIAALMDQIEPRNSGIGSYKKDVERRNGEMLDELEDFGSVTIKSYQGFLARKEVLKEIYDYVILDECHFFLADAKFNKFTFSILEEILNRYPYAIRIYMTATLSDAFVPIMKCELKNRTDESYENPDLESSKILPLKLWGQNWVPWREHYLSDRCGGEYEAYYDYDAVIYELERDYTYLQCRYLKAWMEKPEELQGDPDDVNCDFVEALAETIKKQIQEEHGKKYCEKWLVFVPSTKMGKQLQEMLGEEYAVLVTAEAKKRKKNVADDDDDDATKAYQAICEKKNFSKKVLISTSVLDNGVNIEDPHLKNIAILVFDKVAFLQMLGRKRCEEGESVNLYIREYNKKSLNYRLNGEGGVWEGIKRIAAYKNNKQEIGDEIFENDLIFYYADKSYAGLMYNPFLEEKLICEKYFYEKIMGGKTDEDMNVLTYDYFIGQLKDESNFTTKAKTFEERTIVEQLSWLGLAETFDPKNYVEFEGEEEKVQKKILAREELVRFIETYNIVGSIPEPIAEADELFLEKGIIREQQEAFKERFHKLALKAFGRRPNDKHSNRANSHPTINKILEENDLPYEIVTRSVKKNRTSTAFWLLKYRS